MGGVYESPGGSVFHAKAGAALLLGDTVYISAALTVNKSATVGDHAKVCGVVVGGKNTFFEVCTKKTDYGVITAADANEEVIVLFRGFTFVLADAAVIANGALLVPSTTTAGRVKAGAAITVTATGLTIAAGATPVTSTAANGAIISGSGTVAGDGTGRVLGKVFGAASSGAAGEPLFAMINV